MSSPRGLEGRGAVVTGGGRGIGAAVARMFGEAGAAVVLAARTEEEIEAVAEELRAAGVTAAAVPCDVTSPESVRELARTATRRLGRVDVLVNSAGVAHSAPLEDLRLEDWDHTFAVNATGTFLMTQAFLPGMVERGWGRVVNVASVAGLRGARYIAAYAASKHAVVGFTRCVAEEVAARGVTVNAVCPGYVDTQMTRETIARIVRKTGRGEKEALAAILATSPQTGLIEPREVARVVLELCQEDGAVTNGQTILMEEQS